MGGLVGGNSLAANFVASFVGMIWYFATLTEIPIVEMLTRLGMGREILGAIKPDPRKSNLMRPL